MSDTEILGFLLTFLDTEKASLQVLLDLWMKENVGQTMLRLRIYAIDPEEKPMCNQGGGWIDQVGVQSGLTRYIVGSALQDFRHVDWSSLTSDGVVSPQRTLVFLDDHLEVFYCPQVWI